MIRMKKRMALCSAAILVCVAYSCTKYTDQKYFETQNTSGDKSVTITGYTGPNTVVVIPANIRGKPVTGIGDSAFERGRLAEVTIPASVTSIGFSAFMDNQLTSVTIPNSVTTINHNAFGGNQLASITIPDSITKIDIYAFNNNPLTSVTIGANVVLMADFWPEESFFPAGLVFLQFYYSNGKKAGTYAYNEDTEQWSFTAR